MILNKLCKIESISEFLILNSPCKIDSVSEFLFQFVIFPHNRKSNMYSCYFAGAIPVFKEFHFVVEPTSIVAVDGKHATFDCKVQYGGSEKPLIRWIKHEDQKHLDDTYRRFDLC